MTSSSNCISPQKKFIICFYILALTCNHTPIPFEQHYRYSRFVIRNRLKIMTSNMFSKIDRFPREARSWFETCETNRARDEQIRSIRSNSLCESIYDVMTNDGKHEKIEDLALSLIASNHTYVKFPYSPRRLDYVTITNLFLDLSYEFNATKKSCHGIFRNSSQYNITIASCSLVANVTWPNR